MFYYEVYNATEFAMKITAEAISEANAEFQRFMLKYTEDEVHEAKSTMHVLEHNLKKWKEQIGEC